MHKTAMEKTDQSIDDQEEIKRKVVNAIKEVYDPEIPVDVYELGLIYEITVYPVNNVYILMTLTSPNCPAAESIPSEVKSSVANIEGVNNVEVELTFDPPYSQDMMSEVAKLELEVL
jgi:FeS assembly SUF system protein